MHKLKAFFAIIGLVAVLVLPIQASAGENLRQSNTSITGILTAMSGVSAPANLTVTVGATVYNVEVSLTTTIVRRFGAVSDLSEFMVGDAVEVKGIASNDAANTIGARYVRDISVQRAGGTFHGNIVSTDCDNSRFTYKPKERDQQTVYLGANTKIIRGGEKVACADLKAGEQALVIGLWRQSSSRIDADRVIVKMQSISGIITDITLTDGGLPAKLFIQHKNGQLWTVNVTTATKLFRKHMGIATIDEFAVGDKVEARGTKGAGLVINAKVVRDKSIEIKNRDFQSRINAIDDDADTFTMPISRKEGVFDLTVTTSAETKYFFEDVEKDFDYLEVGMKVKVLGTYNSTTKILVAERVIIKD